MKFPRGLVPRAGGVPEVLLATAVALHGLTGCVGPDVTTHRPKDDQAGQQARMAEIRQNAEWMVREKIHAGFPIEQARGIIRAEGYTCQPVKEGDGRDYLLAEMKHPLGCGWGMCKVQIKIHHQNQRVTETEVEVLALDGR